MDGVTSCSKDIFRRYFIGALRDIGVSLDDAQLFCCLNQSKRLMDLSICMTISIKLDEYMEARVPDYKGCLPKDTYEDIVSYNFSDD